MNKEPSDTKSKPNASNNEAEGLSAKSHEAAEQVKQATLGQVETFKQSAQSMRDNAVDRVRKLGDTVRKVGEHFRVEDQTYVSEHMASMSQRINNVADYIREVEFGSLVHDARSVAARNPGLFFGGALMLGIGAGRFFKDTALLGGSSTVAKPSTAHRKPSSDVASDDDERRISERKTNKNTPNRSEPSRNRASR